MTANTNNIDSMEEEEKIDAYEIVRPKQINGLRKTIVACVVYQMHL